MCAWPGLDPQESEAAKRDLVRQLLATNHPNDIKGHVGLTPEVGFDLSRPFEGLWVKLFVALLDVALDANTVLALIIARQYKFAFALQLVVSYSLLDSLSSGLFQHLCHGVRESIKRGILRNDVKEYFDKERGFEAFFSLCITSYSFFYCVAGPPRL